jgi:large subunit ribosomal protein L15
MQRVPKLPGFTSRRKTAQTITLADIDRIKDSVIDNQVLASLHIIEKVETPVKVVASGQLKSKKTIKLQGASKGAVEAIEKAGGKFTAVPTPLRAKNKTESEK